MALHTCRDFLTWGVPLDEMWVPYQSLYYLAMFARVCLNYSVVGQTSFDIDGAALRKGFGSNASINQGTGNEYMVSPNGYTVSADDVGRILVLKSPNNQMINSGLFRVTAIDRDNNWLLINYRSGDVPPAENGMTWGLYENEYFFVDQVVIDTGGTGSSTQYNGQGASNQSRIILQGPSTLNWQVRFTVEVNNDYVGNSPGNGATTVNTTIAPGFGGDIKGDFPVAGEHLHAALWFNKRNRLYAGLTVGTRGASRQCRIYMWGDDVTGTITMCTRTVVDSAKAADSWCQFGLPEDEETPLPPKPIQRLFVCGSNGTGNSGIYWAQGVYSGGPGRAGAAFGYSNQPISCIYSSYVAMYGDQTEPRDELTAGDNPYLAMTELLPVDLLAGTADHLDFGNRNSSSEIFVLEGRRLGRAPQVRQGRSNYGYFQIATTRENSWLHLDDGIFMPWQGSILP